MYKNLIFRANFLNIVKFAAFFFSRPQKSKKSKKIYINIYINILIIIIIIITMIIFINNNLLIII